MNNRLGGHPMAFKRYITVDNLQKVIYIQVMFNIAGKIRQDEYHDIKKGLWYKYVPAELLEQFRVAINGGFSVRPVVVTGMMNEEYQVLQVADLQLIHSDIIKPVLEV